MVTGRGAGEGGDLDYKARLGRMQREAEQDIVDDVKTGDDREEQVLKTSINGYNAAVISGLIGSFEDDFWWWKVRSSEEQKTRARRKERKKNTVLTP